MVKPRLVNARLANWIVAIVTGVWLINIVAPLVPGLQYKPDPAIHGVFMLVVGGALALKRDDDDGGGDGS